MGVPCLGLGMGGSLASSTPYGEGFLAESPWKLLLDDEPPDQCQGNMTLPDGDIGIGPRPSASAWRAVVGTRVAFQRAFRTPSST
jgi:hypothetical protein